MHGDHWSAKIPETYMYMLKTLKYTCKHMYYVTSPSHGHGWNLCNVQTEATWTVKYKERCHRSSGKRETELDALNKEMPDWKE